MADGSAIEWTEATWNPLTGCTKVSPGCDHCYAETFAERFRGVPGHHFEQGFDLKLRPERLDQPLRWKRPRRIFVNSMSDLFHKDVPDQFIAQVFAVMAVSSQHTFQLLTKRHARMRNLLNSEPFRHLIGLAMVDLTIRADDPASRRPVVPWPLPNVWLGVSVEDQHWADIRIPALLGTPAAIRWISAEPLLGPIDLMRLPFPKWSMTTSDGMVIDAAGARYGVPGQWYAKAVGLDWVVVGGESGPGSRPMSAIWAQDLREQCSFGGVPFLFKQWGNWVPPQQMPDDTFQRWEAHHDGEDRTKPVRVGKSAAGRELDGMVHDGYPAAPDAH